MTMDLELLADDIDGALHVAIVRKGVIQDLYTDAPSTPMPWASICLGRVVKIDPRLDAAIVDLGGGQQGLLPAKHVRFAGGDESETRTGIASLLSAGQMVFVQVKSEGKRRTEHENRKLPRLTMKIYIPGLCLMYSPTSRQVTISSRIENKKVHALAARLGGKGGWILRPPIVDADPAEVERESRLLQEMWQDMQARARDMGDHPGVLMPGPDALRRAFIDYGIVSFEHVYAGNKRVLDLVMDWSARHFPPLAGSKRLRLFKAEKPGQRLFDIYDLYAVLDSLREGSVPLDGGASMAIEATAALTVIDINQGSASSIPAANLAAVRELPRQCRLRNLSGAILIDFINMHQRDERARLMEALTQAFADDRAHAQVHGFTRLGIIEMTRKRRTASFAEKHQV